MSGFGQERHSRVIALGVALAAGLLLAAAAAHGHAPQDSDQTLLELPCATCQQHYEARAENAPLLPRSAQPVVPSFRLPALVVRAPSGQPRFAWPERGPPAA